MVLSHYTVYSTPCTVTVKIFNAIFKSGQKYTELFFSHSTARVTSEGLFHKTAIISKFLNGA